MANNRDVLKNAGKKGAETRARNLTPEERSEMARNAVKSRWRKAKEAEAAASNFRTVVFPLREGDATLILPSSVSSVSAKTLTSSLGLYLDGARAQAEERERTQHGPNPDDKEASQN